MMDLSNSNRKIFDLMTIIIQKMIKIELDRE